MSAEENLDSLKEKVIELSKSFYSEKNDVLHKPILEVKVDFSLCEIRHYPRSKDFTIRDSSTIRAGSALSAI